MATLLMFFMVCFTFLSTLSGLAQGYGTAVQTQLTAPVNATVTTIPVTSTVGFAMSDYIWIDNERISYVGTDPTDFLNCVRGVTDSNGQGGTATTHNQNTQVYTEGLNAINSIVGFNVSSLQFQYGNLVGVGIAAFGFIDAIPRYLFWNIGFMNGSGWSLLKIILLYPLTGAAVLALLFFVTQLVWMLKPSV